MADQAPDSLVIENRALIHLSNIMIANARAHKFKEMARLAKSIRANERLAEAIDTLIALVGSKTLSNGQEATLEEAQESLETVSESTEKAPAKTKILKTILSEVEGIIRAHKWYDMPRHGGSDMTLIEEFYGLGEGQEAALEKPPEGAD